jgi:hypothetical protein
MPNQMTYTLLENQQVTVTVEDKAKCNVRLSFADDSSPGKKLKMVLRQSTGDLYDGVIEQLKLGALNVNSDTKYVKCRMAESMKRRYCTDPQSPSGEQPRAGKPAVQ